MLGGTCGCSVPKNFEVSVQPLLLFSKNGIHFSESKERDNKYP